MTNRETDEATVHRPLAASRIFLAWLMTVAVDLFFNAGLFAGLFDQSKEAALLPDDVLFRRIPFYYAVLLMGVTALAWLLERTDRTGKRAIVTGGIAGLVLGLVGLGGLWTAVDISGVFVVAGIGVSVVEGASAALVLTSGLSGRRLVVRVVAVFLVLIILGQVVANLAG